MPSDMASGEKIFTSSNYIYRLIMKVRLPEFCVKKTPQSSCSPFFLTEYIQIDKLIIKKKKTIVKVTIEILSPCC